MSIKLKESEYSTFIRNWILCRNVANCFSYWNFLKEENHISIISLNKLCSWIQIMMMNFYFTYVSKTKSKFVLRTVFFFHKVKSNFVNLNVTKEYKIYYVLTYLNYWTSFFAKTVRHVSSHEHTRPLD